MHKYEYLMTNPKGERKLTLHFNYLNVFGDDKHYYMNADVARCGYDYHGAWYTAWVLYDGEREYIPLDPMFTSRELTAKEKNKYVLDSLRLLFINGWVITDII